jgi:hypothetical protein
MKRRVPKGARLRTATKLPKRELLRRLKAASKSPKEKPND